MAGNEREKIRHLLVIRDPEGQRTIPLNAATYSLGRDTRNSIVLRSHLVSRQHAILLRIVIEETDEYVFRIIDGSFQGTRSRNGLFVNGKRCYYHDLQHGDIIHFGKHVKAKYYGISNLSDTEFSQSCKSEDISGFLYNLSRPFKALKSDRPDASEVALSRLASFPETIPNPIVEVDLSGKVTYLNPAAFLVFPDLKERGIHHPILSGLPLQPDPDANNAFVREVQYGGRAYEELIHYIPESDLIRLFLADISERKQAERARQKAEKRYQRIFENAVEGIFRATLDGRYTIANPMLAAIFGDESAEETITRIREIRTQVYVDPERWDALIARLRADGEVRGFESEVYRRDGTKIWISESVRALYRSRRLMAYEGSVEEITDRKRAERDLQERDRLLQAAASAANELLCELDSEKAIARALSILATAANADRAYICQFSEDSENRNPLASLRFEWWSSEVAPWSESAAGQSHPFPTVGSNAGKGSGLADQRDREWRAQLTRGETLALLASEFRDRDRELLLAAQVRSVAIAPLRLSGEVWGYLALADCQRDRVWSQQELSTLSTLAASISGYLQRQQTEDVIRYRSYHDDLTDLPNRALFDRTLGAMLAETSARGTNLAVLFLDLDRFKQINDSLGHAAGDRLLQSVAERLRGAVRDRDLVARWGGDEFVVLLPHIHGPEDARAIADRLRHILEAPFAIEGRQLCVTASIGIALFDENNTDAETILRHADAALYRAKDLGRDNYQFFSVALDDSQVPTEISVSGGLRGALARQEFVLYYQPLVNLASGEIAGMEALLRWQHPEKGLLAPGEFISAAEESGAIVPIGEWVLRTACAQNAAWQAAGLSPIVVSVNLSPRQFREPRLVERVAQALAQTGLAPSSLCLEIAEATAIGNEERAREVLEALGEMGVRVAIDDFGSSYSSLNRLQLLPTCDLKFDLGMLDTLGTDERVTQVVRAAVELAETLTSTTIAECVETAAQLDALRAIGCTAAQGYLFHPAVPVEEATRILQQRQLAPHGAPVATYPTHV